MEQSIQPNQVSDSQVKYAGFGIRFLAYWVDFLILFPLGLMIQQMVGNSPFAIFQTQSLADIQKIQGSANSLLGIAIALPLALAYFLIFWVNYDGATPGKRLLGIKIVKDNGEKLTYPAAFIRYIGYMISAATMFFFGIGYLWIIWDKKKQALHDKIAGTIVVKTDKQPKTALAILLTFVAMFLIFSYMGLAIFKGFQLGMQQVKKDTGGFTGKSIKQFQQSMNPEAKIHYDKSTQLFKDMRAVQTDPEKVKRINDENILELKKAIELDPQNAEIWYQLGNAYTWISSTGTLEDGLNAYKKAEEIDPNNVVYINGVGDMLIQAGKYEEAILQFQKTLRLTDKSGYANLSIATAYAKLGIKDSAREHYQKAIDTFTSQNTNGSYDEEILQARKGMAEVTK